MNIIKTFICLLTLITLTFSVYAETDSIISLASKKNGIEKIDYLNSNAKRFADINTQKGMDYANLALDISTKINYKKGIAESFKNIGINYWRMGIYDDAIEFSIRALNIYEELGDFDGLSRANNNIGLIYLAVVDYDKAISYLNKSIQISSENRDLQGISRGEMNLGIVNYAKNQPQQALINHLRSLEICFTTNDTYLIAMNLSFIGNIYITLNKLDSAYYDLTKSLEMFVKLNSPNEIAIVYNHLAKLYLKRGESKKAIYYSVLANRMAVSIGNLFLQSEAYKISSESYFAEKQYYDAYIHLYKYSSLRDSLLNFEKATEISRKEIKFQYDRKMIELEINNKNKDYKIKIIITASVVFSIVLLLTVIIIFNFYKSKVRANKLLVSSNDEIRSQKNELSHLNEKLNDSNSTKDKFFSIVAHDLRSPLGGFKNLLDLLETNYHVFNDDEKIQILGDLSKSSANLYSFLQNLLTWANSQTGKLTFSPDFQDLAQLIKQTVSLLDETAKSKNITLETKTSLENDVFMDSSMVSTVIRNLISNAIKFTPAGGLIKVIAIEEQTQFVVSVSDTGSGMDEITVDGLFKIETTHLPKSETGETTSGSGLGLILCKEFIERHGGTISVESKEGEGSVFRFTIPKNISAANS